MRDVHPFWITLWLAMIACAAMSPMYFFATTIDADEYIKTICGAITAAVVGVSGAGVLKAVSKRKK